MANSGRGFNNHVVAEPELSYEQQVAAKRARNEERVAQLGLVSLSSLLKNKPVCNRPKKPVAPRKKHQQLVSEPVRKSDRNAGKPTPSYRESPLKLSIAVSRSINRMSSTPVVPPTPVKESTEAYLRRFLGTVKGTQPLFRAVPVHDDTEKGLKYLTDKG